MYPQLNLPYFKSIFPISLGLTFTIEITPSSPALFAYSKSSCLTSPHFHILTIIHALSYPHYHTITIAPPLSCPVGLFGLSSDYLFGFKSQQDLSVASRFLYHDHAALSRLVHTPSIQLIIHTHTILTMLRYLG